MSNREQMGESWVIRSADFLSNVVGDLRKDVLSNLNFNNDFKDLVKALEPGYKVDDQLFSQDKRILRFKSGAANYRKGDFISATVRIPEVIDRGVDAYLESHSKIASGKSTPKIGDWSVNRSQLEGLNPDSKVYTRVETVIALAHGSARLNSLLKDGENGIPAAYAGATVDARSALRLIDEAAKLAYNWESGWGAVTPDKALSRARTRINASDMRKAMGAFSFALASCMAPVDGNGIPTQLPEVVTQAAATEQAGAVSEYETPVPKDVVERKTMPIILLTKEQQIERAERYENSAVMWYDENGVLAPLAEEDKPAIAEMFDVNGQPAYIGYGLNGNLEYMIEYNGQIVKLSGDYIADDNDPERDFFAYSMLIDPADPTKLAQFKNSAKWIPIFTKILDAKDHKNLLDILFFNMNELSSGDGAFYRLLMPDGSASKSLSLTAVETADHVLEAPTFVQTLNFQGDWQINVSDDGDYSIVDKKTGEVLGQFGDDYDWHAPEQGLTPEQAAKISEYNTEWNGVLTINPETFQFTSKVGNGAVVEGMVYDPQTGKIKLTFYSDGLGRDFTQYIDPGFIDFGINDGVPVKVDDIVKALKLGDDGQLERVMVKDDGGDTSVPLRTPAELNQMMFEDHSDAPGADKLTLAMGDELKVLAYESGLWVLGTGGHTYIKIDDLYAKINPNEYWVGNDVYVWNEEVKGLELHRVSTYRMQALDNYLDHSAGNIYWLGADGSLNMEVVAGPINIHKMAKQHGQDADYLLAGYGYGE